MERIIEIFLDSAWPILRAGLLVTIPLAIVSFILGLIIATITALMRTSKHPILERIASFYVWVFRGTPLLVQFFIVFFGLPNLGLTLPAWIAAALTLALNSGAFMAETIRSAILAIPKGQWEAAASLGLSRVQTLRRIIAPQSLRIALPPLGNSFISLVKDTSLASTITVVELFMVSQRAAARTYEPLLLYSMAALVYLLFSTALTWLQGYLERRLSY